jgi:predicted DNA-binding transcriptional regulator AlpA
MSGDANIKWAEIKTRLSEGMLGSTPVFHDTARPIGQLLKPSSAAKKFDRAKTWLYGEMKNNPDFPKPLYSQDGMAFFIERELDEYIWSTFVRGQSSDRACRMRKKK